MRIESNENGQQVAFFNAELVSVSERVLENVKGTQYRVGTIKFTNEMGVPKQVVATIYENNFKYGMEVGKSYACRAFATDNGVFTQMSHLTSAEKASFEDFGFAISAEGIPSTNTVAGVITNSPEQEAAKLVAESLNEVNGAKF